jgi:hypothetical protein
VLFLIGVYKFPHVSVKYRASNPSFFPNLLGTVLAVLSVLLAIEGVRSKPAPLIDLQASKGNVIRAGALLGSLVLFVVFFRILGFAIMAFLFTAGLQLILGEKRVIRLLLVAFAVSAVLYLVFVVLLRVSFPVGIFFS